MELKKLTCKNCGGHITSEQINYEFSTATCDYCNTVFGISIPKSEYPQERQYTNHKRTNIPLPKGMTIEPHRTGIKLTRKWFSPKYFGLLFFAIFWNGFMIMWHGIAISSGQLEMAAFGFIHSAVGIGLIYSVLAGFLNTTYINVTFGKLTIEHRPIKWFGELTVKQSQLEQLYCREKINRSKNGVSITYEVNAKMKDGSTKILLKGLENSEQALYIEQEIEKQCKITDLPVAGELK